MATPLLEVNDFWVEFKRPGGTVHAVNGISFSLKPGESLGHRGRERSGQVGGHALHPGPDRAQWPGAARHGLLDGEDLLKMRPAGAAQVRGRDVGMIFQDPMTSLNP